MHPIPHLSPIFIEKSQSMTREILEAIITSPGATYTSITEALFSITDPHHPHIVHLALKSRINTLKEMLSNPPILDDPSETSREIKLTILTEIANKLKLIVMSELERQRPLFPLQRDTPFTRSSE